MNIIIKKDGTEYKYVAAYNIHVSYSLRCVSFWCRGVDKQIFIEQFDTIDTY